MAHPNATAFAAYTLLVRDLERILEYVEPRDPNLGTFSQRTYELFLRICTEFEGACRQILRSQGYSGQGELRIRDYETLNQKYDLHKTEVGLLFWRPTTRYVHPFVAWTTPGSRLAWYQDYNKVKHDREAEFSRASLDNVTLALSGLHLLFERAYSPEFFSRSEGYSRTRSRSSGNVGESTVDGAIFSLREGGAEPRRR